METLAQLFGVVCGQNPDHTWMPGGLLLPCCQRCLGLYVGAAVAVGLHGWLRPQLSGRFLEVHGLFLLLMVPFGFHWLPQGALVRTGTGVLFGFGWWPFSPCGPPRVGERPARARRCMGTRTWTMNPRVSRKASPHRPSDTLSPTGGEGWGQGARFMESAGRSWRYGLGLAATLGLLPALAAYGGRAAAGALSGLAFAGALLLAALAAANVGAAGVGLLKWARRQKQPAVS